MHRNSLLLLLSLLPLISLSSCQLAPTPQSTWQRTDLYLGLTRRDSSLISDTDFQKFTDTQITPLFPDGFTLTPAAGQYLDSHNSVHKEPTRILTLLYETKDRDTTNKKLQKLITTYCQQFDQESILREDFPITAQFTR